MLKNGCYDFLLFNHINLRNRTETVNRCIDLRNAFGEVHHNFLTKVLEYHLLQYIAIIKNLYNFYKISITANNFTTHPVTISSRVLQGDSLPLVLFNMCFNTLMVTILQEKVKCLGYVSNMISPKHWLQFVDDTAIITSLTSGNQMLLILFSKWADLVIRIDKCHTFGIWKTSTQCTQYQPYLTVNNQQIPILPNYLKGNNTK